MITSLSIKLEWQDNGIRERMNSNSPTVLPADEADLSMGLPSPPSQPLQFLKKTTLFTHK
ncbi:hypothetical protein HNQ41_001643 [Texcoconibacillus texcoconensis]|uniref:Uncharacterized protein n=1 Tax=Texcoconibacillus texcoconensis TaxID=1095777 RepID=A0A840QPW4_9BACI|nr:hypothetical protein [Texcoconibacillus texcoconensis]